MKVIYLKPNFLYSYSPIYYTNTYASRRTKVINPEINPIKASQPIFFRYQKNSIFSIPIATTPAADPITNTLPPVPAEYAIKCHRESSIGWENIPIEAATNGTLSITAEPRPKRPATILMSGITTSKYCAN